MEQLINTLVSSLLGAYLPISEMSTRFAMAIAGIISRIYAAVIIYFGKYSLFDLFTRRKYSVVVNIKNCTSVSAYNGLIRYINNNLHTYVKESLSNRPVKSVPVEFTQNEITTNAIINGIDCKITISVIRSSSENDASNDRLPTYIVSSVVNMDTVNSFIQQCSAIDLIADRSPSGTIVINKIKVKTTKSDRTLSWETNTNKTGVNTTNTIVSYTVKRCFYNDLEAFLTSQDKYLARGHTFKRGYLLYGEPGCGKTSSIKAIAPQYNIPIFNVDLSVIKNNNELVEITTDIRVLVTVGPYIW